MNYVYQRVGQDGRSAQTPHYGHIEGDGDLILRAPQDEHLKIDSHDYLVQTVFEVPEPTPIPETTISGFVSKSGYLDPDAANFGRNDWSAKLGESKFNPNEWNREVADG